MSEPRRTAIQDFLAAHGWGDAALAPLAGDASARRYWRVARDAKTAVVMDAPPAAGQVSPFVAVAERLKEIGLSAPTVLATAPSEGLLLLEDFGDRSYTAMLAAGANETALYARAVDALIQKDGACKSRGALPLFDDDSMAEGVARFTEWYAPAVLGGPLPGAAVEAFLAGWRDAMAHARAIPQTLVLFDYHVDNLMVLDGREGTAQVGLLDFQDAVWGPVAFDLVSLLQDARRTVAPKLSDAMMARYLDAFPDLDREAFATAYAVLGAQRAARIIGTFTRLDRRDGKPGYLRHIDRVWSWLEQDLRHPALERMRAWFDTHLPADRRVAPAPQSGEAA